MAPQDREEFIDYFAKNFGPDKPPAAPNYGNPVQHKRVNSLKQQ